MLQFQQLEKKQIVRGQRNSRPGKILMSVSIMPYSFSASFGLVRNPVGWDNVTVVISSKPELFEVNCKLSATHYSNSAREGQKDQKTQKKRQKSIQQYKDTKCKVSTTYYSNSTRAGQKDKKKQNANKGENTKWQQKQNEKNTKTQSVRDGLLKKK